MKQLAKLAQAIVHGPQLLILDEPTNGLDPPARLRMLRLVREMRDQQNMRVVLCSHLLRDVEDSCDEVLILKDGQVVHYANLEQERSTNRRFVEMEAYGNENAFESALAALGCHCAAAGGGRFRMVLSDGIEISDIYRVAAEQDVQLRRLNFRRDSLEDIFLRAMNGSLAPQVDTGVEASNGHL
jgi:ABC-2 type transport system ATP-binding protein